MLKLNKINPNMMNRAERESLCTELGLAIKEETMQLRQQEELPWHMIISEGRTVSSLLNLKAI